MDTIMFSMDTSTKKSGISIFKNGIYEETILIDLDDKKLIPINKRFPLMVKYLVEVLNTYHPTIIYIEEAVVTKNADTQRFLLRMQGVIYLWCFLNNCEFNTIRPTEWRSQLELNGASKYGGRTKKEEFKERSIHYIKNLLGFEMQEDAAESLCIGIAVLKKWNINIEVSNNYKFSLWKRNDEFYGKEKLKK